jgi:glycosyltransferase involved in cell wall biosynthesis
MSATHPAPAAPTVSVMMPVYNTERYLAEAVESILAQTFADFELIAVDDGSTDGSGAILERYAARDGRVRVERLEHGGIVAARNRALELARGEFCAVMDSDDVALPGRLERQVAYLRDHPEVLCVGTAVRLIDPDGRVLRDAHAGMDHERIQEVLLSGRCPLNHPSVLMRRAAVLAVGGYRDGFAPSEDLDLFLRLGEVGRLANLPEVLQKYRQHPRSASEQGQRRQLERAARAVREACQRRGLPPRDLALKPWRPTGWRSRMQTYVNYGWWGFQRGDRRVALRYGLRAVGQMPWHPDGWRLLACAVLKRPPRAPAAEARS